MLYLRAPIYFSRSILLYRSGSSFFPRRLVGGRSSFFNEESVFAKKIFCQEDQQEYKDKQ